VEILNRFKHALIISVHPRGGSLDEKLLAASMDRSNLAIFSSTPRRRKKRREGSMFKLIKIRTEDALAKHNEDANFSNKPNTYRL
jgi:hypothetical protein